MEVIVLGSSGGFPAQGGACSSYLLKAGGKHLLIDCGSGVMARITAYLPIDALDAVVLTHLHFDHCGDLPILGYGLQAKIERGQAVSPLTVFMPSTPPETVQLMTSKPIIAPVYISDRQTHSLGHLHLAFTRMPHSVESYAITIVEPPVDGGTAAKKVVFSGDTTETQDLVEVARGVDLLVCDSSTSGNEPPRAKPNHLTARQAARIGLEAGVRRLCLTHLWYEENLPELLTAAQSIFSGAFLAQPGLVIRI